MQKECPDSGKEQLKKKSEKGTNGLSIDRNTQEK